MIRRAALATTLALTIAGYVLLLLGSPGVDLPQERKFGGPAAGEPRVYIYLEVVSVDALRDAMQVRVSVEPTGWGIDPQSKLPDRDLALVITHDKRAERVEIHAHQPLPTTTIELDLHGGDITSYPLDAYRAGLSIRCFETPAPSGPQPAPLAMELTTWERVLGFRLQTSRDPGDIPGEDRLSFEIHRSRAFTFFALAAYGTMVVLAGVALTIGGLVFLGVRRPEATLMGALGTIVFALPVLRNALPGGPPLGVSADVFIFLWAELAAVFALMLLVATWVRAGPSP